MVPSAWQPAHKEPEPQHLCPDPCLAAILLVVSSTHGPKFVWNYPANPKTDVANSRHVYGTELVEMADSDTDEDGSSTEEEDLEFDIERSELGRKVGRMKIRDDKDDGSHKGGRHQRRTRNPEDDDDDSTDEAALNSGANDAPWEKVFGFPISGLESILTPAKWFNKKKFELNLDPLIFLSYPIHRRDDCNWKKKKPKKPRKRDIPDDDETPTAKAMREKIEGKPSAKTFSDGSETSGENGRGTKRAHPASDSDDGEDDNAMTMFNVVFVLNPPRTEHLRRVGDMYECVVKKFTKALKYAQAESDYVWRESKLICRMLEKAKEESMALSARIR
jgi:hypothetical protein